MSEQYTTVSEFHSYSASVGDWGQVVAIPDVHSKVWKDECMFCFCNSECIDGLCINMKTFQGFCSKHLALDLEKNPRSLYLVEQSSKIPIESNKEEQKVDKLAIGVAGGFDVSKDSGYEFVKEYSLKWYSEGLNRVVKLGMEGDHIPEIVRMSAQGIQGHDGMCNQTSVEAWEEERKISKYAEALEQIPCSRKIPMNPEEWKCDETGVTDNLWLNLGTGHIGSGRPQWDGTGGNGAAMRHYEATGKKYPLVVKLGTITPAGADVYSYASDEDDMVLDPQLGDHLAHWGINMMKMEKTEKSMTELQIERNINFEFDTITESGAALTPLSGTGFVGLNNLGNSCYINSILQLIWKLPDLHGSFLLHADEICRSTPGNPAFDFLTQFTKVGMALASEAQGCQENPQESVSPWMFKKLCGMRHPEFATSHQQDAQEFLGFLLEQISREEHQNQGRILSTNFEKYFEVGLKTRIECQESHRVSYRDEASTCLSLQIPLDLAINAEELEANLRDNKRLKTDVEEEVVPRVKLDSCFQQFCKPETLNDYFSAFLNKKTTATKTVRIHQFPKYLALHMRRYYVDDNWTPQKLNVKIEVPEKISLEPYRMGQQQDNELLQPERAEEEANGELLEQLLSMGFEMNKCKKALLSTGNSDLDAAMEHILMNTGDDDLSEDSIQMLCGMGFSKDKAKKALLNCDGNVERAVDWLFNHPDDDAPAESILQVSNSSEYELVGFVSHIGKNTSSGHYVCHVKKDGVWTIFNDEKVAKSCSPPKELGYIYLFKQT